MNDISRAFGFTFRDDVLYSNQPAPEEEHYPAPMVPHPAIEHVPAFDFAVSCSIDPGLSLGRPVVAATGLWSMPADFDFDNFMSLAMHVPETRFGAFIQAWSTHGGKGRVVAWGDSTIFSNFCLYQPGKAQVLLNLVEWLNHQGGTDLGWLWTCLGLAAIGVGLWLVRRPERFSMAGAGGGRGLRVDRRFDGHRGAVRPGKCRCPRRSRTAACRWS